jgi:hypothetical protein
MEGDRRKTLGFWPFAGARNQHGLQLSGDRPREIASAILRAPLWLAALDDFRSC